MSTNFLVHFSVELYSTIPHPPTFKNSYQLFWAPLTAVSFFVPPDSGFGGGGLFSFWNPTIFVI